jgi:hypothetical protein
MKDGVSQRFLMRLELASLKCEICGIGLDQVPNLGLFQVAANQWWCEAHLEEMLEGMIDQETFDAVRSIHEERTHA